MTPTSTSPPEGASRTVSPLPAGLTAADLATFEHQPDGELLVKLQRMGRLRIALPGDRYLTIEVRQRPEREFECVVAASTKLDMPYREHLLTKGGYLVERGRLSDGKEVEAGPAKKDATRQLPKPKPKPKPAAKAPVKPPQAAKKK